METPQSAEVKEGPINFHARISAKWIPVLRHFMPDLDSDWCNHKAYGLHIRPNDKGGVSVMATNGRIMAIVHDIDGATTMPVNVHIPQHVIEACEPPKLPLFFNEGEWLDPPTVPGWMSPKWLGLFDAGVWVEADDPNAPGMLGHAMAETSNTWRIGCEYRVSTDALLVWDSCLPTDEPVNAEGVTVCPMLLGRICLAANSAGAKSIRIETSNANKPIGIEFVGVPEITAVLMPIRTE